MRKLITLLAGVILAHTMALAQTVKDPQQEINQLQQKVRTLQSADQQIKNQVSGVKNDLLKLEQGVTTSLTAGDSLLKAGLDSVRIANQVGVKNEEAIGSLKSRVSLQQNLLIVALVLLVCLFLLYLWQRRAIRLLAQSQEEESKKLLDRLDQQQKDLLTKQEQSARDLSNKLKVQQDSLAEVSRKTEEKISVLGSGLSDKMTNLQDSLTKSIGDLTATSAAGLTSEQKKREEGFSGVNLRLAAVDEKIDAGLDAAVSFQKQEADHIRKEISDLKRTLQEAVKAPRGRGTSAE